MPKSSNKNKATKRARLAEPYKRKPACVDANVSSNPRTYSEDTRPENHYYDSWIPSALMLHDAGHLVCDSPLQMPCDFKIEDESEIDEIPEISTYNVRLSEGSTWLAHSNTNGHLPSPALTPPFKLPSLNETLDPTLLSTGDESWPTKITPVNNEDIPIVVKYEECTLNVGHHIVSPSLVEITAKLEPLDLNDHAEQQEVDATIFEFVSDTTLPSPPVDVKPPALPIIEEHVAIAPLTQTQEKLIPDTPEDYESHRSYEIVEKQFATYRPIVATKDVDRVIRDSVHVPGASSNGAVLCNRRTFDDEAGFSRLKGLLSEGDGQFMNLQAHVSGPNLAKETMDQCIALVKSALTTVEEIQNRMWLSVVDSRSTFSVGASKRCGILEQYTPAENMFPHPDLAKLGAKWASGRPLGDKPFRVRDESGLFTLDDLKQAMRILTSRPPRRINKWAAPQLFSSDTLEEFLESIPEHPYPTAPRLNDLVRPFDRQVGSGVSQTFMWKSQKRIPSREMREVRAPQPPEFTADGLKVVNVGPGYSIDDMQTRRSLYKPMYVTGKGSNKQGWCENCPKGGFFKLKNSGYLYHKNHAHGIYANDGVFEDPLMIRRRDSRDLKWEGLCGICYRWVDIDHRLEDRWGTWFRHYNSCAKEYDDLKAAVLRTGAPVQFLEIEYNPYVLPFDLGAE